MLHALLLSLACASPQDDIVDHLRFGEERIEIRATGELGRRRIGDPETEIGRLLERASARERRERLQGRVIPEWRVVLLIVRHLETERADGERGPTQRTSMSEAEVLHCLESYGTFVDLAHAASEGRVKIRTETVIAERPIRVPADEPISWLPTSGQEIVDFLSPGDADSVIAFYKPGSLPIRQWGATQGGEFGPGGAAISSLALVPEREKAEPDALALATLHEWLHQVEWLAQAQLGYEGLPGSHDMAANGYDWAPGKSWDLYRDLLRFYLPRDFFDRASLRTWARHRSAKLKAGADPLGGLNPGLPPMPERVQVPEYTGETYDWEDVRDDPFGRLPRLSTQSLGTLIPEAVLYSDPHVLSIAGGGYPRLRDPDWVSLAPVIDPVLRVRLGIRSQPALDRALDFHHESVALCRAWKAESPGHLILVRPDLAQLVYERLATSSGERPRAVGTILSERRAAIVFLAELFREPRHVLDLLEHPVPDALGAGRSRRLRAWIEGPAIRGREVTVRMAWSDGESAEEPLVARWWRRSPRPTLLDSHRRDGMTWSIPTDADSPLGTWVLSAECRTDSDRPAFRPLAFELQDPVDIHLSVNAEPTEDTRVLGVVLEKRVSDRVRGALTFQLPSGWVSDDGDEWLVLDEPRRALTRLIRRRGADGAFGAATVSVTFTPESDWLPSHGRTRLVATDAEGRLFFHDFERRGEEPSFLPREGRDGPGEYSISWDTSDPISGARSLRIDDGGGSRYGRVQLFGDPDDPRVPITERTRLPITPKTTIELALRPESPTGELAVSLRIDGEWYSAPLTPQATALATEAGRTVLEKVETEFGADGAQHVRIAIGEELGDRKRQIDRIDLGDPRPIVSNRFRGQPTGTIVIDDFVIRER